MVVMALAGPHAITVATAVNMFSGAVRLSQQQLKICFQYGFLATTNVEKVVQG
jgi:hypothetical protein